MAARSRCSAFAPPSYAGARSDDGHVYVGGFSARMQPDGTGVEILGFNFRNSYEQTVTSFGDIFHNDNDDPPACRTSYLMEYGNFGFFSRDGKRYWQADRRPGQSIPTAEWRQEDPGVIPAGDVYGGGAPTGIVFNEGDGLGEKYRGLLLSAEAARNTIFGYFPKPDGAGYQLERFDFLTSNKAQAFAGTDFKGGKVNEEIQTFFRPSDVAVGPDGAIYVADWFDPRVGGHDDKDDTTSGAIYRIAPKGFVPRVPAFDAATVEGQLTALRSPAVNVRALGFNGARGTRRRPRWRRVQALLDDEQSLHARARRVAAGALGRRRPRARREVAGRARTRDLRVAAYRALRQAGTAQRHAARLARDPSPAVRREVALSQRDVPFEAAREVLLTLAQGYDGKDRSLLEAWGTGATHKEEALYAALAATAPGADAAKWPRAYADLVWRLTPRAAVPAFAARAQSGSLPVSERTRAITALGFIPTREAAFALLDVAQGGGKDLRDNPALWWLLNYKDSRWADAGIDAELKRRGLFDPATVTVNDITVPAPRGDFDAAGGGRHREAARQREAGRHRGRRLPDVPSRRGRRRRLRTGARWVCQPPDAGNRDHRHRESFQRHSARLRRHGSDAARRAQAARPGAERRRSAHHPEHRRRDADDPGEHGQGAQAAGAFADDERRAVRPVCAAGGRHHRLPQINGDIPDLLAKRDEAAGVARTRGASPFASKSGMSPFMRCRSGRRRAWCRVLRRARPPAAS